MSWLVLLLAVVLNASANILMKAGVARVHGESAWTVIVSALTQPFLYAGIAAFGLALVAYAAVLNRLELSVAYPVMTSAGLVIVAVASRQWLGEGYDLRKTVGTALVIAGVILLTSQRSL